MIERFNFYDVYGYLFPGAVMLGLGLAPIAVSRSHPPSLEWTSAVAALLVSYVLGHVMQELARVALPSTVVKGSDNVARYPSDVLLDDTDPTIPKLMKDRLGAIVLRDFGIDIHDRNQRQSFFNVCRQALQASDSPSYAEQFQGLYTFMRGLAFAAIAAAIEYLGWVYGSWVGAVGTFWVGWTLTFTVLLWMPLALNKKQLPKLRTAVGVPFLAAFIFVLGVYGGTIIHLTFSRAFLLALCVPCLIVVSQMAIRAYKSHAWQFALTVYEGFYVRVARKKAVGS